MSTNHKGLQVWIQGVGLLGPGLATWAASQAVLRGEQLHASTATVLPPPARLPAAERRRAGSAVKLAMAVADEAVAAAQVDAGTLATVFTSSSGECSNCHSLCEALATPAPVVSPTRFTNSVHNASSGAWHIAVGSRASSTSLCAFNGSFGAGLIEAAASVCLDGQPILLVASDSPYPEPLNSARPLPDHFGAALLLSPARTAQSIASLTVHLAGDGPQAAPMADASLDALRRVIPAAAALPLLVALAQGRAQQGLVLDYLPGTSLRLDLEPVGAS
ncbi:beta-ketoacyl synthase chain length factor [Piscinibacter gummiphilus]|uniref:Beta-ketoacyl synthase chain length factor n=1 Tax=Piscinibacter gummiphilus TaxID=946333 RepID=A0ABZ0D117_9BURK|nr:beta-ketoacyl synthase chain length factor [Piscinibacter gummiphilus]WOB08985.1 beta-ketoacyl synthase chain length factor [Piscinibacter gummiphilus]